MNRLFAYILPPRFSPFELCSYCLALPLLLLCASLALATLLLMVLPLFSEAQVTLQESNETFDVSGGNLDYDPELGNDYNGNLDYGAAGPAEASPPAEHTANEMDSGGDWLPPKDLGLVYPRQVTNSRLRAQPRFPYSRTIGLTQRLPVQPRQRFADGQPVGGNEQ